MSRMPRANLRHPGSAFASLLDEEAEALAGYPVRALLEAWLTPRTPADVRLDASAGVLLQRVLRSWVAKEALIKQRRSSISLELGHWWMESKQPRAMHLPTGVWWPVQVHCLSFGAEQWFLGWSGDNSPSLEYLDCS